MDEPVVQQHPLEKKKHLFDITPENTIRVFIYLDFPSDNLTVETFKHAFDWISMWGSFDKRNVEYVSWEFDMTLLQFLLKRFGDRPDFDCQYIQRYAALIRERYKQSV